VLVGRGGIGGIGPLDLVALGVALTGVLDAVGFGVDGCGRAATGGAGAGAATVTTVSTDGATRSADGGDARPPGADELLDATV
jgi:hypothetical protein